MSSMAARSALVPRRLSGGSIAGAVVGSVVGSLLLLLLCIFPFILRIRRRRRTARHDGDADIEADTGQSPSTGGRSSSSPQLDESKRASAEALAPAHGRDDKPGPLNGPYPTSDPPTAANGHDLHPKASSDHPPEPSSLSSGVAIEQRLPSPVSSSSPRTSSPDQPAAVARASDSGQAYPASPADQPTPLSTTARSRSPPSLSANVSKQGARDLSVTDSYGPPSRELTGITTAGFTQEPEPIEHPSQSPTARRFSHLSGSIRSLLHRRRDSQQRRDSKRSTGGATDGARSPSVSTTEAYGQPDLPQPLFEVDINAQGEAWSYYHDPNLVPPSSAPAPSGLFPPVSEAAQAPLSPISLPDQQPLTSGIGVPPFMISQNVVAEPYDIFPDGTPAAAAAAAPIRPYAGRPSLLRGPSGTLNRTDSLPPLQPIVSDIGGPALEFPSLPSGVPMFIMGPPTNEAESAHHLQHEMLRINSPPQPAQLPLEYPEPSEEVAAFIKNDLNGVDLSAVEYGYNSPPDIAVNGQDFSVLDFNSAMMGGQQQLDPQAVTGYASYFTPPPSSGPSIQNTPETRLSEYTASPSPRSDVVEHRPGLEGESSPRTFPCDQCDRSFDQVHKLNHHKRYHDRPHECTHPGCTMRFGTKTHLERHINDKHNKTRKFYCTQQECPYSRHGGKSFPRKDNWRRHMVNKHRITPDTDPVEYNDETMIGT